MRLRYRSFSYVTGRASPTEAGDDEMERLFHEAWPATRGPGLHGLSAWRPPMDMYETPDRYIVRIELAGAREEEIDVALFADRLVVTGRRMPDHARQNEQVAYHMAGIMYGDFRVTLRIPPGIDPAATEATYTEGFLTIILPKQQSTGTRQLPVDSQTP